MKQKVKITVIVENNATGNGLIPEHGLCFWLETGDSRIIFDTGQGMALPVNAGSLDIPIKQADAVVLSHGHYDHTGGLKTVMQLSTKPRVYLHPAAFGPKFACNEHKQSRFIGTPDDCKKAANELAADIIHTTRPTQIAGPIFATGEIPRTTEFEDAGGPFFLDQKCEQKDPFPDDQALFFESSRGTVVLLGCAHAGVINTLLYVRQLTKGKPVHAVIGGMHLLSASDERLDSTIEHLGRISPGLIGPAHCTGDKATEKIRKTFTREYFPCSAGTTIEFD